MTNDPLSEAGEDDRLFPIGSVWDPIPDGTKYRRLPRKIVRKNARYLFTANVRDDGLSLSTQTWSRDYFIGRHKQRDQTHD